MVDLKDTVTLEMCLEKLNFNRHHYSRKGFDLQIFFVGQLFKMTYDEVVAAMNMQERKLL